MGRSQMNLLPHALLMSLVLLMCLGLRAAGAEECPGHPDAIGTSRTLVVDPTAHPRLGTMQYPETLPLRDHEIVLSFDDGPLPRNSNQILDILAAQCVKATFFTIGEMARAYPEGVRKLRDAGHSIGTHSQTHPLSMNRMPTERVRQQVDDGIASVTAALGGEAPAPFFRIPGLLRAGNVEEYLGSKGIQVWSADFLADDWRHISSARVFELALKRLEEKGRGILLLHDIQARTVAALPLVLRELKLRGYHIVHVVAASPDEPATPSEPWQWHLHPQPEDIAVANWPQVPNFVFTEADQLPAPALSDLDWPADNQIKLAAPLNSARPTGRGGVPLPRMAPWPRLSPPPLDDSAAVALPIPAQSVFEIEEKQHADNPPSADRANRLSAVPTKSSATRRPSAPG